MPYIPRYLSFYLRFFRGASFGDTSAASISWPSAAAAIMAPASVSAIIAEGEIGAVHP